MIRQDDAELRVSAQPLLTRMRPSARRSYRSWIVLLFGGVFLGLGVTNAWSEDPPRASIEYRPSELADIPPLKCRSTAVPDEYSTYGSGYTAFTVGPDGTVYLGTARYYDYGYWVTFDPKRRAFDVAAKLGETLGEHLFDHNTQGKTHTKLIVGPDGIVYGGTKQGHELFTTRPEIGEEPRGYPGGHMVSYNPKTGQVRDHGIMRAQDGLMNCVLDAERKRIYFKTEPRTHFIVYDMKTNEVIDKGRVGTWGRYIDMDRAGNIWIPNHGRVTKYDVERDELFDLHVEVLGEGAPYKKAYACVTGKNGTKLYGGGLSFIQEFDLTHATEDVLPMRYVCRAVPEPFESSEDVHTMVCDEKGRIYWTARVAIESGPAETLIMRYTPGDDESECLGFLVDPDDPMLQTQTSIQGSAIGPDGSLFLMCTYPYFVAHFPKLARK